MESAAQSIMSKLGQLAVDELQGICGVGDKVVHLMDELSTMNAFLRMISEADQSAVDHLVREWEKQVRELAYDAEDSADIYHLRIRRPMTLQFPSVIVKWPKYQLKKLWLRHTLAADVKALLARTAVVSERRARYGIDRAALPRSPWFASAPVSVLAASASENILHRADDADDQFVGIKKQVDSLAKRIKAALPKLPWFAPDSAVSASAKALRHAEDADDQFVGIKEQVDTLADKIKAEDNDRSLKVFSIVGFGGLGKTTLAAELCRHLKADFQRQAMVSLSQAFDSGKDMKGLLARLLQQMKLKEDDQQANDGMDVESQSNKLKDLLKDKRYLIVIDDVWSVPAWEAVRVRLPENNYSSRIMVTTRIETVAKASSVSEDFVHHMKPMKEEDSKKLFIKRVFGSVDGTCPDGLKDTMDKILKKCGGLPLAIVSIASLLASYNSAESVEMWIKVSNSIGSMMETHPTLEGMSKVITLSYDFLPHHLKACMMYLSIFPEDYVITKDRLLYRWIAEGLVTEKRGLTLLDVAEEYFNELISKNMIQPDKLLKSRRHFPDEMVKACRVHDMMLEVMVSKSRDANFVSFVGRQYGGVLPHGKARRLSVHDNDDYDEYSSYKKKEVEQCRHARHGGIEVMNLQHVRSLATFQSEGLNKLLDRLDEFKLLRVLDLEDCSSLRDEHMGHVCRLYLLRFLSLRGTSISVMPSKIGDLEYLETLDVVDTSIYTMPPTVTKLHRLEHLRMSKWTLPRGLGNMKALREVDYAYLNLRGNVQVAQEIARGIGELQQLQVLYFYVDQEPEEEILHELGFSLSKTCALRSLNLCSENNSLDFLIHVSSPPPLLRRLTMEGLSITRFPDWISSLKHLAEFSVRYVELPADQLLDSLCKLPSLQSIELGCGSLVDRQLVVRTTHKFPALKILELDFGWGHPDVVKFEEGAMTKLETLLLVGFGDNRRRNIVGTANLKNLKEVKFHGEKDSSMEHSVEQLKVENEKRHESNQIEVVVEYWW